MDKNKLRKFLWDTKEQLEEMLYKDKIVEEYKDKIELSKTLTIIYKALEKIEGEK